MPDQQTPKKKKRKINWFLFLSILFIMILNFFNNLEENLARAQLKSPDERIGFLFGNFTITIIMAILLYVILNWIHIHVIKRSKNENKNNESSQNPPGAPEI